MGARLSLSALAVVACGCGAGSCVIRRTEPAPSSTTARVGPHDDDARHAAARRAMVARQIARRGVRDPEGGRLCAPMDDGDEQVLVLFTKRQGRLVRQDLLPVRFVPMTGRVRRE